MKLTAVFEKVPEGYIGFIEELPGANTQGATIEEARSNLKEAVELVLEANRLLPWPTWFIFVRQQQGYQRSRSRGLSQRTARQE